MGTVTVKSCPNISKDIVFQIAISQDLLGDGAKIIEEKIMQSVYAKIGMEYVKTEGYAFPEYIMKAREEYLKRKG